MKEIAELNLPADIRYSADHEWVRLEGDRAIIGVSDYAQDQMGDITFVEAPEVGDELDKGQEFGTLESTKAVSDLFMPMSGEVVAVNGALADAPGLINQDPYGQGWIIEVKANLLSEWDELLTKDAYLQILTGA